MNFRGTTKIVGEVYKPADMKKMVGLFKQRRRTFKRRFTQIMKKLNPRVIQYMSYGSGPETGSYSGKSQDRYKQQLTLLRKILLKKDFLYNKNPY